MHGHTSRWRFDTLDRFWGVVALQGRLNIDADANENTTIVQVALRSLAVDLFGPQAFTSDRAFQVALAQSPDGRPDLTIGAGRGYVDGLPVINPTDTTYFTQPDAHFTDTDHPLPDNAYFVFVEVWERLVTHVQQPEIVDRALGVQDSSARSKIVCQVRGAEPTSAPADTTRDTLLAHWAADAKLLDEASGRMLATLSAGKDDELCALSPTGADRRATNQHYRIEIHRGGVIGGDGDDVVPACKWSRDNGAVVFPVARVAGATVTVTSLGRDDRDTLNPGDCVEYADDASALNREPLDLRFVKHVDRATRQVTLDAAPIDGPVEEPPPRHALLRRWDQLPTPKQIAKGSNAILITDRSIVVEDGITATFSPGTYRSGDHWNFWTRGDELEWAGYAHSDDPTQPRLPDGIRRSIVPLAYVEDPVNGPVVDLRSIVEPLPTRHIV